MAVLTVQSIALSGATHALAAASAGGDQVPPGDRTFLHVKNGSGAGITVTIAKPGTDPWGGAWNNATVAVAAGAESSIGPLNSTLADPSTGNVLISYSSATSVTVQARRL